MCVDRVDFTGEDCKFVWATLANGKPITSLNGPRILPKNHKMADWLLRLEQLGRLLMERQSHGPLRNKRIDRRNPRHHG